MTEKVKTFYIDGEPTDEWYEPILTPEMLAQSDMSEKDIEDWMEFEREWRAMWIAKRTGTYRDPKTGAAEKVDVVSGGRVMVAVSDDSDFAPIVEALANKHKPKDR